MQVLRTSRKWRASPALRVAALVLFVTGVTFVLGSRPAAADPSPVGFQTGGLTAAGGGVFDLTGMLTDSTTVSGTLTINLVTGVVTAADLSYGGQTFSDLLTQFAFSGGTDSGQTPISVGYVVEIGISSSLPRFVLIVDGTQGVDTLAGYAGGTICTFSTACGPDEQGNFWASDYHPPASATPEPGTLCLFGTALLGLGFFFRRRLATTA